jgi:GNAT superfamily N-acetyltransferase
VIDGLTPEHDRATFDCGHAVLDDWLKQRAGQFDRRDLARTYVAVRSGERRVLGYYAISTHGVRREDLPDDQAKGLPRIDVPVVLLGRLAVDRSAQGSGLGSLLMIDALRRIELLAEQVGIRWKKRLGDKNSIGRIEDFHRQLGVAADDLYFPVR